MARVAALLLGAQRAGRLDLEAAVLPERDPAVHRRNVLVTEQVLERVSGKRRTLTGRAVKDDRLRLVTDLPLDSRLEIGARDVDGSRDMRLLELVLLADVDQHRHAAVAVRARQGVVNLAGIELAYLVSNLSYQL